MSQLEKIIAKVKQKPIRSDIEFDEVKKVYEKYGFKMREGKGSHVVFYNSSYPELSATVPRPHGGLKEVKRIYIKELQDRIEIMEEKK